MCFSSIVISTDALAYIILEHEEKNAVNSSLQKIQKMVEKVKEDKGGVSGIYEDLGTRTDDPGRGNGGWNCRRKKRRYRPGKSGTGKRNRERTPEG